LLRPSGTERLGHFPAGKRVKPVHSKGPPAHAAEVYPESSATQFFCLNNLIDNLIISCRSAAAPSEGGKLKENESPEDFIICVQQRGNFKFPKGFFFFFFFNLN
jgi:hypothetical protein